MLWGGGPNKYLGSLSKHLKKKFKMINKENPREIYIVCGPDVNRKTPAVGFGEGTK